ncbi:TIGR03086 family metal-binding protein [Micromonospora sp. KLBMP9576]|uniref:TIGR03086 family metal-binding protein n=1 Tax=Micromonospora sp. KLBMP9576 TaxID=3424769 RepID=UPI003D8D518A
MTTRTSDLLTMAAPPTVAVVHGIADDQLDLPTPCGEYAVRDLTNHLFQVVVNFQALAARQAVQWADGPDLLTDGWRDRFATETRRLVRAWSDPSSLEGVSETMGMPQTVVGDMVLLDLAVHGWDLAVATGQPYRPAPEVLEPLRALVERLGPQGQRMGVFAEPVTSGADLTEFELLLCRTGRDPGWSPVA